MCRYISQPSAFILSLADGSQLLLHVGDEDAARIVNFFAQAAELSPAPDPLPTGVRRMLVTTDVAPTPHANGAHALCMLAPPGAPRQRTKWDLIKSEKPRRAGRVNPDPLTEEAWFWQQLTRLSGTIARETQPQGGALLHSGLAAHPDLSGLSRRRSDNLTGLCGVLLAGRSGVGKSTACRRLPPPWQALADETTLVVRDTEGTYWAHPWPTWSYFFGPKAGDGSDRWDVQRATPLQAIMILEQGAEDRVEPLGPGHALALLAELARQASRYLVQAMPRDEVPVFHRRQFDNLSALVRAVPAYFLHVSLEGTFWEEIERVLKDEGPALSLPKG